MCELIVVLLSFLCNDNNRYYNKSSEICTKVLRLYIGILYNMEVMYEKMYK